MGHRSRMARRRRFVSIPNETVDHFEYRSPVALGLLTINLRHANGYPITLDRVQRRAQHGSRKLLAEARHILLDDGYAMYLKYTVRGHNGGRPEWESLTQYADTPHSHDELDELVHEHTPGRWLMLKDNPAAWRRMQIVHAEVTFWDGARKINHEGLLEVTRAASREPGKRTKPAPPAPAVPKAPAAPAAGKPGTGARAPQPRLPNGRFAPA